MTLAFLLLLQAPGEIELLAGYGYGNLKRNPDNLEYAAFEARIGLDVGADDWLQFGLGAIFDRLLEPEHDILFGFQAFLRVRTPASDQVDLIAEIGGGPVYLGIDTVEQDHAGFNFVTQLGFGIRIRSLLILFRFRHLSNANLRDNRNIGIDSRGLWIGAGFEY